MRILDTEGVERRRKNDESIRTRHAVVSLYHEILYCAYIHYRVQTLSGILMATTNLNHNNYGFAIHGCIDGYLIPLL